MGPHPAVAAVRLAVRRSLSGYDVDRPAVVACSGGADSLALAAASAFECRAAGRPAALVTVDHGLQDGSDLQASRVAAIGFELGFDPVTVLRVDVASAGGPEAAARTARYAALERARFAAGGAQALVLLGHTADDQAETVLLGLGRGSGPRSIAGMRADAEGYLRPLLGLRRAIAVQACAALDLPVWDDPHNDDPRFRRVRLRREVLPLLEDVLAGGVVEALARTASQLADDLDALDGIAATLVREATVLAADELAADEPAAGANSGRLAVAVLAEQPQALRARVLKLWAEGHGTQPLAASHLRELSRLISDWRGQGPIDLPGGYRVQRASGSLEFI
ncbi:MAG: tRNA(Ile)-lysidine synthase [Pseudonocardiales bacterium]|jgi:tRNA(Ile)-lysidine synthase|nr:tRNA(Ile)-lysidine synthase [Pseudonocardiales bacterium]